MFSDEVVVGNLHKLLKKFHYRPTCIIQGLDKALTVKLQMPLTKDEKQEAMSKQE